jgi:hypothetical protein
MAPDERLDVEWRPFGWSTPRVLLAGLLVAFGLVLLVAATTSTAGFSPYNANWDGNSEFRELADSRGELVVATSTSRYETVDPATSTGFVLAPDRQYGPDDATRIRAFVEGGGTLVVADNYGPHGNALLSEIGATARFDGRILRDERNNFRSSSLPIISDISSHRLLSGVDALTLNYGTAIEPGAATPIANSSDVSYLAANDSDTLENGTEIQQYPVVTVETVGDGRVVAVGDPSLFINSMLAESDNRLFVTTLVDQRTTTLFDQSHGSAPPPLVGVILLVRSSPAIAAAGLAFVIGLIAIVGRESGWHERLPWRQWVTTIRSTVPWSNARSGVTGDADAPTADRAALKARLRQRHPDWDEERLDRVIAGVLSEGTNSSDNE